MEILSYGMAVKVISPENLIREVKKIYTGAAEKYGTA
jgi:predicted DNA-binding transcriptional regulator YafY